MADGICVFVQTEFDNHSFTVELKSRSSALVSEGTEALGALYDLVAPRVLRYARLVTRDADDADDALQAAMVRLALHPRSLHNATHPWAYLLRIVRNEALRVIRRRRPWSVLSVFSNPVQEDAPVAELEETQGSVRAALSRLPKSQSEVLVLKIWEGLTFAEIAVILNESPNTVASRYRYGTTKLREWLQPLVNEVQSE